MIKVVKGNTIKVKWQLFKTVEGSDVQIPCNLDGVTDASVTIQMQYVNYTVTPEVSGNLVTFMIDGEDQLFGPVDISVSWGNESSRVALKGPIMIIEDSRDAGEVSHEDPIEVVFTNNVGTVVPSNLSYEELNDKPAIDGIELHSNSTAEGLGLVKAQEGMGLSENSFTDDEKTKLRDLENNDTLTKRFKSISTEIEKIKKDATNNHSALSNKIDQAVLTLDKKFTDLIKEKETEYIRELASVNESINDLRNDTINALNSFKVSVDESFVGVNEILHHLIGVVTPLTISMEEVPLIQEKGTTPDISLKWVVTMNGKEVIPSSQKLNGQEVTSPKIISPTETSSYTLEVEYSGYVARKEFTIEFVDPSFFNILDENDSVVQRIEVVKGSKEETMEFTLDYKRIQYVYPEVFGELSSIKDGNGFENISAYKMTKGQDKGVPMLIYTLSEPVTVNKLKQHYR